MAQLAITGLRAAGDNRFDGVRNWIAGGPDFQSGRTWIYRSCGRTEVRPPVLNLHRRQGSGSHMTFLYPTLSSSFVTEAGGNA